jgi:hypothetical protein
MQFAAVSAVSSSLLLGPIFLTPLTSNHQCCLSICMLRLFLGLAACMPTNTNNNIIQLPQQFSIYLDSQQHRDRSILPPSLPFCCITITTTLVLLPLPLPHISLPASNDKPHPSHPIHHPSTHSNHPTQPSAPVSYHQPIRHTHTTPTLKHSSPILYL